MPCLSSRDGRTASPQDAYLHDAHPNLSLHHPRVSWADTDGESRAGGHHAGRQCDHLVKKGQGTVSGG
eukprot:14387977-Alexandrium_andersonii.AAC.1